MLLLFDILVAATLRKNLGPSIPLKLFNVLKSRLSFKERWKILRVNIPKFKD